MIYVTGDIHGNLNRIKYYVTKLNLGENDIIIILGDSGFNYYCDKKDVLMKKEANALGVKIFNIHGNHEERPFNIPTYKLEEFNGGLVYVEEEYPNLLFAKDGEIYDFDGLKTIVLGGAYSIDKHYRLMKGWNWFKDEQPSMEIKKFAEKQLENNDWTVDVVLSHTCPVLLEPTEWFLDFVDQSTVDKSTENWLQEIMSKLNYKYWFCGHYHGEKTTPEIKFFFENFEEFPEK